VTTLHVRLPRIEEIEFNDLLIIESDLNAVYEVTAMTSLNRYQENWFPLALGPRRWSRLVPEDRPHVTSLALESPLDLILRIPDPVLWAGAGSTISSGLLVAIRFQRIIAAGLDIVERIRLMPHGEREAAARAEAAELENERTKQSVRVLKVKADALEALRNEIFDQQRRVDYIRAMAPEPSDVLADVEDPSTLRQPVRRRILEVSDEEKAQLLEAPIHRLIALSNGEAQITVQRADPPQAKSS
jgi:hypothetical protein